jgi:general secretion pathway protein A
MYLEYWGFQVLPFENVPDPRFFFLSRTHEEALTRLIYAGKMRKGGAMLSGEIGCGKTTLIKVCIQKLSGDQFDIGVIINPRLEPLEFIQEVLYQFGTNEVPETKVKCLQKLNEKMIENVKLNKETLLLVDEAQLLTEANLEEIRLLLNFQLNHRFLMTIILVGQPELKDRIKSLKQLDQRIPIKYHLEPFNYEDTASYIGFRLNKAGRKDDIFSTDALKKIYEHSQGVPRNVNNLCDLSLLLGYSQNENSINSTIVESVINDGALL